MKKLQTEMDESLASNDAFDEGAKAEIEAEIEGIIENIRE